MVNKHRAFTLMEVIVALSLFAISILVLTQSFLNGLICKTQLSKEDFRPLLYQTIRSELAIQGLNLSILQLLLCRWILYH